MPRVSKPYLHKGWYRTNTGGKRQHPLCREEEGMTAARRALNRYLGQLAAAQVDGTLTKPPGSGIVAKPVFDPEKGTLAGEVHDEFLDFKKSETEPLTYQHYVNKLKPFLERFGHRPLATLTERDGHDFKRWLLTQREWVSGGKKPGQKSRRVKGVGPVTCNHFLRAAKMLLNWAASPKRGYLQSNPWDEIRFLREKSRERLITDEEFRYLLEHRCVRLGLIEGEKSGEKLVLYSTRHTRITEMLREGVGLSAAAKEAGHSNASTTDRHYSHLSDSDVTDAVLRSSGSRRSKGGGGASR